MSEQVSVTITRQDKYRFLVDFGAGMPTSVADEPAPLGADGAVAVAPVGGLHCELPLREPSFRAREVQGRPGRLTATAACRFGRNDKNRLRVVGIDVTLTLGVAPETLGHLDRALAQFEEFCTVSQSVKAGIPFTAVVLAPDGRVLKSG